MAKLSVNEIRTLAKTIVKQNAGGIRYSALVQRISADHPETPKNTIHGATWDLATRFPTEITKPSRGLFLPAGADVDPVIVTPSMLPLQKLSEQDFYAPFADWLRTNWMKPQSQFQSAERAFKRSGELRT